MSDHTINFPTPTVHGQLYPDFEADPTAPSLQNDRVYEWNSLKQAWEVKCEGESGSGGGVGGDFLGRYGDTVSTEDPVQYHFETLLEFKADELLSMSGSDLEFKSSNDIGILGTNPNSEDSIVYISRNATGSSSHKIDVYQPITVDATATDDEEDQGVN